MKKSRFTESQIVGVLKQVDAGSKVEDVCREYGISSATYYNWKAKYGGMEASDLRRKKDLEEENARLKRIFADLSLTHEATKDLIKKRVGNGLAARGSDCGDPADAQEIAKGRLLEDRQAAEAEGLPV